jgi:DNA topoisomerase VI subunit A
MSDDVDFDWCASPAASELGFLSPVSNLSSSWQARSLSLSPVPGPDEPPLPSPTPPSTPSTLSQLDSIVLNIISRICAREDATFGWPGGAAPLFARGASSAFTGARAFVGTLRALNTSASLLRANKTATCRELYYMHAAFFSDAPESAGAIARVQAALTTMTLTNTPRHSLGLFAASRGWVAGSLFIDGVLVPLRGTPIGAESASPTTAPTLRPAGARFILVVEKEALFRRLCEDRLWESPKSRCVIVTGCGQPDLATRAFVRALADAHGPGTPVLGLADSNPYGLAILLAYARGSAARPEAASSAVPSLRWLGLRGVDIQRLALPSGTRQRTTRADDAKARSLLNSPAVQYGCTQLKDEVAAWIGPMREKVELEGVLARGLGFFSIYLRNKLGLDVVGGEETGPLNIEGVDALRLDAVGPPPPPPAPKMKVKKGRQGGGTKRTAKDGDEVEY